MVKGEVKGCDVVLARDGQMSVVELKKSFNMTLLYQALDRKKLAGTVYIAIPRRVFMKNRGHITYILEKLDVGLIIVAMDSPLHSVDVVFVPKEGRSRNNARSRALTAEMAGRTFDGNVGGSARKKLLTAHRERNIHIACVLEKIGHAKPAQLVKEFGCHKNTGQTLLRNIYGWFEKTAVGTYGLSGAGIEALDDAQFAEIIEYYRNNIAGGDDV